MHTHKQGIKMHTLDQRKAAIVNQVADILKLAKTLYNLDINPTIRFDLTGRCAGIAGRKNNEYYLRFNTTMMMDLGWDHILNDTVPHELAHLVCYKNPRLGSRHDAGWKKICMALGGNGKRCHDEQVIYSRGDTYTCNTTTGHTLTIGSAVHRKILLGAVYTSPGRGEMNRDCKFEMIASGGVRILAATPKTTIPPMSKTVVDCKPKSTRPAAGSKADAVRTIILQCKQRAMDTAPGMAHAIQQATITLNMTRSLATAYVKNNWAKVVLVNQFAN
jgi:predicted SprT family Zn-dependent metalloprotease